MKTKIIKINPKKPEISKIKKSANIIKKGGLVAFPTETVYGLGANGLNKNAVKKIFKAKGRPQDNPLILHISNINQLSSLVEKIPKNAEKLIKKFWPGPLTIILKKSKKVPEIITAGLDSVAVRMPKNKIALELIKSSGCPLAAPSANLSGKPSPTIAEHVIEDLNTKIDAIIDGRKTDIGLESTVIDLTQEPSQILRPGKITKKQIEKIIGKINNKKSKSKKPRSPGMKYRHYSPKAKIFTIQNKKQLKEILKKYPDKRTKILKYRTKIKMGKNLFKDFREADKNDFKIIIVWNVKEKELGNAIMDRLKKASS